jgi:hypothetical protein
VEECLVYSRPVSWYLHLLFYLIFIISLNIRSIFPLDEWWKWGSDRLRNVPGIWWPVRVEDYNSTRLPDSKIGGAFNGEGDWEGVGWIHWMVLPSSTMEWALDNRPEGEGPEISLMKPNKVRGQGSSLQQQLPCSQSPTWRNNDPNNSVIDLLFFKFTFSLIWKETF